MSTAMTKWAARELPILFTGAMVLRLLDGSKTQTRRVTGLEAFTDRGDFVEMRRNEAGVWVAVFRDSIPDDPCPVEVRSPYGGPGDRLWVKESWWERLDHVRGVVDPNAARYVADGEPPEPYRWRKRVSIHMPRWASRIRLEVASVRVERLHDISEADAIAEGVEQVLLGTRKVWRGYAAEAEGSSGCCLTARDSFGSLWESINGDGSWSANPWVWVVEFKRALEAAAKGPVR